MSTIRVTVSVEIDGRDAQACSRTVTTDSGNPLFHALEVEKAAASATASCVEMVAAAQGGDIRDRPDAARNVPNSRYLAMGERGNV